jgi:RimJ/RimL family protein N-acetyltransferase
MTMLESTRLRLDELTEADSGFALALLNDAAFIAHIGDRQVRNREQAAAYLQQGPIASYRQHGFGMYAMRLKYSGETIGMCGLVKRDSLQDVDIGYALLPAYRNRGYALEAARCVMDWATGELGLRRLAAIVDPTNTDSIALLGKLGMAPEGMVRLSQDEEPICLYAWAATADPGQGR